MSEQIFVDSSAIIAMMLEEDGFEHVAERIAAAASRHTSAMVILECVMRLSSIRSVPPDKTEGKVRDLLAKLKIATVAIDDATASQAIDAFQRFGKGRHPSRLNLGDCFSYACAKQNRLKLLYKGSDFARTDLA